MIIPGSHTHFTQFRWIYMQGNIKTCSRIHHENWKHLCCTAEVRKTEGVGLVHPNEIISIGISGGSGSTTTEHTYSVERPGFVHIKNCSMDCNLLGNRFCRAKNKQRKENRIS